MRLVLFFVVIIVGLVSCKTTPKKLSGQPVVSTEKQKSKDQRPVVNSINGKYIIEDSTQIKVFAQVDFSNINEHIDLAKLSQVFRAQWTIQTDGGIREKLKSGKIDFSDPNFKKIDNRYHLVFYVPRIKNQESGVLILDFIDAQSATKYTFDLPLDFHAKKVDTRFGFFNEDDPEFPQFTSFITVGKSFSFKSLKINEEELYLIHYENKSGAALSPMSNSKRDVQSEFVPQDTLKIKNGQKIQLSKQGMYVLTQNPENIKDGYGFMVVNERFPRITFLNDLREPLVYLSTPKEIEQLKNTEDPKEALDMYFLNVAKGNQTLAKQLVKTYFKRVSDANNLFTNYKEGWKTDKGMVYIVMGPPSRVQRNRQREVWLYSQGQNNSEIIYTFYRKANVFTDQNYELVRYPEYSSYWYPYVEAWRTGNVAE